MSERYRCMEAYCANNSVYSCTYEGVMGFLCDACEARADEEERMGEWCPVCGDTRLEHDDPFPCPPEDPQV